MHTAIESNFAGEQAPLPAPTLSESLFAVAAATTMPALARATASHLHAIMPCHSIVLFDGITARVRPSEIHALDAAQRDDRAWQELIERHPMRRLLESSARARVITSSQLPGGGPALQADPFYRQVMLAEGFDKLAVLPFWHRGHLRAMVSIRRSARDGTFSAIDLGDLRLLHAILLASLSRLWTERELRVLQHAWETAIDEGGACSALFDMNLAPLCISDGFRGRVSTWLPRRRSDGESTAQLPVEIADALRQLQHQWVTRSLDAGETHHVLVRSRSRPTDMAKIFMRTGSSRETGSPHLEVCIFGTDDLRDDAQASSVNASLKLLTGAEQEVVRLVQFGLTNAQIAGALGKLEGTVKIQLHSVYRKLGVPNRTSLLALLR